MIEIEAKLRITDDTTFPALLQLGELSPFRFIAAPNIEQQRNTYLDTADRALHRAGYTLRVRELAERRVATLKRSLGSRNGLFQRREWQVPIDSSHDPHAWPAGQLRDEVLRLLGGALLAPQFVIRTRRQHIYVVRRAAPIVELSLDEGTVTAGNRAQWFRELELELLEGGTRLDLDTLMVLLSSRFALVPETRSKASRGRALLDRVPPRQLQARAVAQAV